MIKKIFCTSIFGFILSIYTTQVFASPAAIAPAVYAKLTSTGNQLISSDTINQWIPIALQSINNISGMEWDTVNNRMVIKRAGVYVILSDMQLTSKTNSDIYYWIEHNGTPLLETGKRISAKSSLLSTSVSNSWILPLKEGDTLRFIFSSNTAATGLMTIPATNNVAHFPAAFRPSAPGFTLTMFMLQKPNNE